MIRGLLVLVILLALGAETWPRSIDKSISEGSNLISLSERKSGNSDSLPR